MKKYKRGFSNLHAKMWIEIILYINTSDLIGFFLKFEIYILC